MIIKKTCLQHVLLLLLFSVVYNVTGEGSSETISISIKPTDTALETTKLLPSSVESEKSKTEKRDSSFQTATYYGKTKASEQPFRPIYAPLNYAQEQQSNGVGGHFEPTTVRYVAAEASPQAYYEKPETGGIHYAPIPATITKHTTTGSTSGSGGGGGGGLIHYAAAATPIAPTQQSPHRFNFNTELYEHATRLQQQQPHQHIVQHLPPAPQKTLKQTQPPIYYYANESPVHLYERLPQQQQHQQHQQLQQQLFSTGPHYELHAPTAATPKQQQQQHATLNQQQQQQNQQQQRVQYIIAIPLSYMRQLQQQQQQQQHQQQQQQHQLLQQQQLLEADGGINAALVAPTSTAIPTSAPTANNQHTPMLQVIGPLARDHHGIYRPFYQQQQSAQESAAPTTGTQYFQLPGNLLFSPAHTGKTTQSLASPMSIYQPFYYPTTAGVSGRHPHHHHHPQQLQFSHGHGHAQQLQLNLGEGGGIQMPLYAYSQQQQQQQPHPQLQQRVLRLGSGGGGGDGNTINIIGNGLKQQQQQQGIKYSGIATAASPLATSSPPSSTTLSLGATATSGYIVPTAATPRRLALALAPQQLQIPQKQQQQQQQHLLQRPNIVHYNPIYVQTPPPSSSSSSSTSSSSEPQQQQHIAPSAALHYNIPSASAHNLPHDPVPIHFVRLSAANALLSPQQQHHHHQQQQQQQQLQQPLVHHYYHHPQQHLYASAGAATINHHQHGQQPHNQHQANYDDGISVPQSVVSIPAPVPYFSHPGAVHYGTHLLHLPTATSSTHATSLAAAGAAAPSSPTTSSSPSSSSSIATSPTSKLYETFTRQHQHLQQQQQSTAATSSSSSSSSPSHSSTATSGLSSSNVAASVSPTVVKYP